MGMTERVKILESKLFVETDELPEGVFLHCVDCSLNAVEPEPVKGWHYLDYRILRAPGESDDDLASRAFAEVKPFMAKNAVPVFHSINEVKP